MKNSAIAMFASSVLAQQQLDFQSQQDKDLWAHQALLERLSQCSSVKIQNVATGQFLTEIESAYEPSCLKVTIKKEGHGLELYDDEEENVGSAGQTFNLVSSGERTMRIESSGSALGLHANRRETQVGCSMISEDPYTSNPLHTSGNWALFRTNEITEDNLTPDDLLTSEWYITAFFVKDPRARLTKYDENLPETASRMLTARTIPKDSVEALLVLEDIKSLENLREQAGRFAAYSGEDSDDKSLKYNHWKFICQNEVTF